MEQGTKASNSHTSGSWAEAGLGQLSRGRSPNSSQTQKVRLGLTKLKLGLESYTVPHSKAS